MSGLNEVVIGIDGLDWYQPSSAEPETWLMRAPVAYVAPPASTMLGRTGGCYRYAAKMQAPLPTFLPQMGLVVR